MSRSHGWKNVTYASYDDLPKNVQSYDNEIWAQKQIDRLKNIEKELDTIKDRNSLLVEYINQYSKNNISILDYGGGIGLSYFSLLPHTDKTIDYSIVELPSICDAGKNANVPIKFYQNIPKTKFDIVYIRTALQYTKDWKKTLRDLTRCNPKYIILSHLSAGNIPTYLTLQIWGDYLLPYWFINIDELNSHIENNDYKNSLIYNSYKMKQDFGWKTYKYFPDDLRLENLLDIVYTENKK